MATFVIIFSLAISIIILNIKVKSEPMNYPIVYDKQGFTRFRPSFNYMEQNLETYGRYEINAF